ncbi:transglycosylase SLT domain-containing protein [Candidatus Rhodobacter oscarellae]|nr:lytic transglycosylase [Candidatus Rhodobacter lobularis]
MSRIFLTMALMAVLAGCGGGGGNSGSPRNLDNACSILKQKPKYTRAFKRTERRWGVPVHVQMATIHQESRFVSNARTPFRFALGVIPMGRQSSAFGYSQALDGTWDEYLKSTGKRRAKRNDIADATDFMGWYMNQTRDRTGVALTDTRNQYLAYHEGQTGYLRGSYNRKAWLLAVADKVEARGQMYQSQLARCRVRGL